MDYEAYKEDITTIITETVSAFYCQPVLFVGSGFSLRYFGAPNWSDLLQKMIEDCPKSTKPFAYYEQTFGNYPAIGSAIAAEYKSWAWEDETNIFPKSLFETGTHSEVYLKFHVADHIKALTPADASATTEELSAEIDALAKIRSHAIITTNYDEYLEGIFNDYTRVISEDFIKESAFSVGEVIKIHGCVSEPESIVITEDDYKIFSSKRKYLSAKLLTFFREHPVLFVGYSAKDPNIAAILYDIDEALSMPGELIPNLFSRLSTKQSSRSRGAKQGWRDLGGRG